MAATKSTKSTKAKKTSRAARPSRIISFTQNNDDEGLRDPNQENQDKITSFIVNFELGHHSNIKQTCVSTAKGKVKDIFQTIPDWLELKAKANLDAHKIKLAFNTSLASYVKPTKENGYKEYEYIDNTLPPQVINGKAVLKGKSIESFNDSAAHDRSYCYITNNGKLRHKIFTMEEVEAYKNDKNNKDSLAKWFLENNVWQSMNMSCVLVDNGEVVINPKKVSPGVSARTSIGQKEDGTFVVMAVNGKSGYLGITHRMEAQRLKELGCVRAYSLDGGGSTTLWYNGVVVTQGTDPKNGIRSKKYESYEYGTMYIRKRPHCMYLI